MITVDGDMSTNDAVFALANGLAGNAAHRGRDARARGPRRGARGRLHRARPRRSPRTARARRSSSRCASRGAPDDAIARELARAVAGSSLVKAAIFGADPNWGRVLVGHRRARRARASGPIDPTRATVHVQGTCVYDGGRAGRASTRSPSARRCASRTSRIDVAPGRGRAPRPSPGAATSRYDYVKINADYTSLTHASPDGTVARDDRLTNYSPGFKRALLVEALSYIRKFTQHARRREVRRRGDGEGLAQGELRERHQPPAERGPPAHRRPRRRPGDHAHDGEARPRQERVRRRRARHRPRGREGRRDGAHRAGSTPSSCRC